MLFYFFFAALFSFLPLPICKNTPWTIAVSFHPSFHHLKCASCFCMRLSIILLTKYHLVMIPDYRFGCKPRYVPTYIFNIYVSYLLGGRLGSPGAFLVIIVKTVFLYL